MKQNGTPDTGKARQVLDWTPAIPPEQGLAEVVDYFRQMFRTPAPANAG
ncbi:hypothetical protein [Salinisphaera sp.]|nr:hypothetical protein [Salinisphaera sp.]HET7315752.1 hypothetical protein [Salinisphaera sp.]